MVCDRCKGKYVGASATGKRHRYRYYICSTRQRYGLTGCDAERIRADELETAVFAALVQLYAAPDLLADATTAHRKDAAARTRQNQKELTALDAELRKTEAATQRYMLAFENGTVTEDMFGDRVHELGATARTLRAHRAELHAAVDPANTGIPTLAEIDVVRQQLATAAEHASAPVRKALAHAFVHELRVEARNRVRPTYKLCRGLPATNTDPAGRGVRTMKPVAAPTGFEPVPPP
ncbi:MAG: recombinase zinc beta ribbon domain-containing protein [Actinobacteria bacterium]|nr:recombinase zinc beta ribbon domain-containing protein [Actinomycetota bacterium]